MKQKGYTIETHHLILAVVSVAAGSGFYNGYSSDVISIGIDTTYNTMGNETETTLDSVIGLQSLVILSGSYGAGCFIGTILIPVIANNFGRKGGLFLTNAIGIAIPLLDAVVTHQNVFSVLFPVLSCSRFLLGIVNSISLGIGIIYLIEISPTKYRGAIGCLYPLFKLIGSSALMILTHYDYHKSFWSGLIAISIIPLILLLSLLYYCPESPVFLYYKNKTHAVTAGNSEVLCAASSVNAYSENNTEFEEYYGICTGHLPTLKDLITDIESRNRLILSILVLLSTWLVGPYYVAPKDFLHAESQFIITRSLSIIGIIICACTVDKMGRKPIFLIGLSSICVNIIFNFCATILWEKGIQYGTFAYSIMTICYGLQAVVVFTLPFILISELSPKARPLNFSVAFVVFYILNSPYELFSKFFAGGEENKYLALFEALLVIFFIVFMKLKLPETKGKHFGEINSIFILR